MGSARFASRLEPTTVRAPIQWEQGVDIDASISARFGNADHAIFTSIRLHPRQEMT